MFVIDTQNKLAVVCTLFFVIGVVFDHFVLR